jgi:hypothetical protein
MRINDSNPKKDKLKVSYDYKLFFELIVEYI